MKVFNMAFEFLILLFYFFVLVRNGESLSPPEIGRRDAISKAAAAASVAISLKPANAATSSDTSSDTIVGQNIGLATETQNIHSICSMNYPPPILSLPIKSPSMPAPTSLNIPRVGFSFYKTAADQAERCAALALRSGVTHLDLASQYGTNAEIGKAIRTYLRYGRTKLASEEKPDLLQLVDASYRYQKSRIKSKLKKRGSAGRREELFISHKISNDEQSTDPDKIRRAVLDTMDTLGVDYLDMVSIHSPLTNSETRLATYRALADLQQTSGRTKTSPVIRSIGVCNYGLGPLKEIMAAGLPLPAVNQLEMSPFNRHLDIVEWCDRNGVAISCAAWSKLSGPSGPSEQWDVLSKLAKKKNITKAQALVRWSLQKGYICVPRSGSKYKLERVAIVENSYGGIMVTKGNLTALSYADAEEYAMLTPEEMAILDGLDVNHKAGKLGRTDGWSEADIKGADWDPTQTI